MAAEDGYWEILGTLAAAPAPITAEGECLLCAARFTTDQALDGGIGRHAPHCAWQRARARQGQLAKRLLSRVERPAETPIGMALRLIIAACANAHRQLDDAQFLAILLSLGQLAGELKCGVQLARQVQRAMRADSSLADRLIRWTSTAEAEGGPHGA